MKPRYVQFQANGITIFAKDNDYIYFSQPRQPGWIADLFLSQGISNYKLFHEGYQDESTIEAILKQKDHICVEVKYPEQSMTQIVELLKEMKELVAK